MGYEFENLRAVGKRLVNEFQRYHPLLCKPSPQPSCRYIRLGSPEENLRLQKLIADVVAQDPEPKPTLPACNAPNVATWNTRDSSMSITAE